MLSLANISFTVGKKEILKSVSAEFSPGKMNMILGPNGSGKSTLMKIFSGEITTGSGQITYDNIPIADIKKEHLAMRRAFMSQQSTLSFPLTVEEVVLMGRYPHFKFKPTNHDKRIALDALEMLSLNDFSQHNYLTLSGGEKQRVQFARALAQIWDMPTHGNRFLFLDEPLNSLDIKFQQSFLRMCRDLLNDRTVIVLVMHDVNLAVQYADEILLLKEGEVAYEGAVEEVLTKENIESVFEVNCSLTKQVETGRFVYVF